MKKTDMDMPRVLATMIIGLVERHSPDHNILHFCYTEYPPAIGNVKPADMEKLFAEGKIASELIRHLTAEGKKMTNDPIRAAKEAGKGDNLKRGSLRRTKFAHHVMNSGKENFAAVILRRLDVGATKREVLAALAEEKIKAKLRGKK